MSKLSFRLLEALNRSERGASLVEYGLLVVAILVAAAAAYKTLGPRS
jgi:Flp pilus assembly pilin Flp